jgi:hypothetical protein
MVAYIVKGLKTFQGDARVEEEMVKKLLEAIESREESPTKTQNYKEESLKMVLCCHEDHYFGRSF